MAYPVTSVAIGSEQDVVAARQRTRQIASLLGFDVQDRTRLATAVSELARNAFGYAGGGKVDYLIEGRSAPQVLIVRISDKGPGIPNLKDVLGGRYRSRTGLALGIAGARRLVDQFEIDSGPDRGTTIWLKKLLPARAPFVSPARLREIGDLLLVQRPHTSFDEIKQQNRELLQALSEARERQEELARVNRELEDTNRGVVALYAELDERVGHLRRADEMKSRFLSNMSHEFRTPLNSILALSRLLLERVDGALTAEQEKQVGYIRKSAEDLLELVNDLLDLAKIEAGKIEVHPIEFTVDSAFSALRGMLRPLLAGQSVRLVFESPEALPVLYTDESKLSQILRNFISNALKFTERGEVRVKAEFDAAEDTVRFSVSDTGIGIAPEDQTRIFEEFAQIDSPAQRKVRGTGLGLPLCRKLAGLLQGCIELTSRPGSGSTFSITIPVRYTAAPEPAPAPLASGDGYQIDDGRIPILVIGDEPEMRLLYEKLLQREVFQPIAVAGIRQAQSVLQQLRPAAILLDILRHAEGRWTWLAELKGSEKTRDIPVGVVSTVDDPGKALALGADAYLTKPIDRRRLLEMLERLAVPEGRPRPRAGLPESASPARVMIIDDEPAARYVLTKLLRNTPCLIREAENGMEGLRIARELKPNLIFLDLNMPDLSGYEVLNRIKADPLMHEVPIAVVTSATLTPQERERLENHACAIVNKAELSRECLERLLDRVQSGS